jgi:hypothetical protein
MFSENRMDPRVFLAYLLILTQIEEMIIAKLHVQMVLYHYRSYQYHYSRYCMSFIQNMIKMVNILLNLPSELDIVILQSSDHVGNET